MLFEEAKVKRHVSDRRRARTVKIRLDLSAQQGTGLGITRATNPLRSRINEGLFLNPDLLCQFEGKYQGCFEVAIASSGDSSGFTTSTLGVPIVVLKPRQLFKEKRKERPINRHYDYG